MGKCSIFDHFKLAILGGACILITGCVAGSALPQLSAVHNDELRTAVASPSRSHDFVIRDRFRHPYETLKFFRVRPTDTVVEIWPAHGWYTQILAPYVLRGGGTYYAAVPWAGERKWMQQLSASNPERYGGIRVADFSPHQPKDQRVPDGDQRVSDGTADVVLTFRNVHNWFAPPGQKGKSGKDRQDYSGEAFRQIYAMLRPGGILGIVDHRLPETADRQSEGISGYIKVSTVRQLAESAGFRFAGSSEINANPHDTANWPNGVWSLPPQLRGGAQDRDYYLAIGESDRMTLLFVKPR